MRVERQNQAIRFDFSSPEVRLLLHILARAVVHYRLRPGDLDPRAAAVWYSTRGCAAARMSEAETKEWVEHLHFLKSERIEGINCWRQSLSEGDADAGTLELSPPQATAFMMVLNDYRLLCAAMHGIEEGEMAVQTPTDYARLPAQQRQALFEIHFLAWVVEETVQCLVPP